MLDRILSRAYGEEKQSIKASGLILLMRHSPRCSAGQAMMVSWGLQNAPKYQDKPNLLIQRQTKLLGWNKITATAVQT